MRACGELILRHLAEIHAVLDAARDPIYRLRRAAELPAFRADRKRRRIACLRLPAIATDRRIESAQRRFHQRAALAHGYHAAFEKIRLAHEIRHEARMRRAIHLRRFPHLPDVPAFHDRQPVRDRQRLLLIVGDVDRREPEFLAHAPNFGAHLDPQFRVEIRQRLIQEQAARANDERPRERHALLLAAGKLIDLPLAKRAHLHRIERLPDAFRDLRRRHAPLFESERDVLRHRHVWPQRVALKHHARVAFVRRHARHIVVAEKNAPAFRQVKSGDGAQQRRLPATARPEEEKDFARLDAQVDRMKRHGFAETLGEFFNGQRDHESNGRYPCPIEFK